MITSERKKKYEQVVSKRQKGIVVVIENISDPHNAQAVCRSCDAFGIDDVYFIFEETDRFNPKKKGAASSATANKWLNFHEYATTKECFNDLKKNGYTIIGTALDESAENIFSARFDNNSIALVFGNEHAGLSDTARSLCDRTIFIPMRGMIQSLNLSVTAALCMYEVTRQRMPNMERYIISSEKQSEIMKRFDDIS